MKKKPIRTIAERLSFNELFPRFESVKIAEGVSEKTIRVYYQHGKCIGKHLDAWRPVDEVTQDDINCVIVSMRRSGLDSILQFVCSNGWLIGSGL